MKKTVFRMAGVASVLALATQVAWAATGPVQASLNLTNLTYKLTDLNTTDHVTPNLTSLPESTFWAFAGSYTLPSYIAPYVPSVGSGGQAGDLFHGSSASVALSNGQGSAAKSGNGQHADTSLPTELVTQLSYPVDSDSSVSTEGYFKLGAYSKLVISGDLILTTQIDSVAISAQAVNLLGQTLIVNSTASFNVLLRTDAGIELASDASSVTADQLQTYQRWVWTDTASQSFSALGAGVLSTSNNVPGGKIQLEITNNSNASIAFSLDSRSSVSVSTTTAVPEPGAWALMGLGLLGVVAAAGKHRRFGPDSV